MKYRLLLLFLLPLIALADTNWQEPSAAQADAGTLGAPFAMTPRRVAAYVAAHGGSGAVTSVFGRAGVVVADVSDYSLYYGQLSTTNSWTGVNTFAGSFTFTPDTQPVVANAATLNIAKYNLFVTNGANVTLTPSAAGTSGQRVIVNVTNSDTAAHTVIGAGTASTISYTMPASGSISTVWVSNGAAWTVFGGAPTINDLGTVAVATGDLLSFWDISGGTTGKATVASLVSAALTGTPATVAQGGTGLATLTSGGILVGAGTGNVTFITPGGGVAAALAIATNAAGGFSPIDGTATLSNKRVTPRITTITSSATPTVNTDNCDCVTITAQAVDITSMTTNLTGTPVNFDQLEYRITGTAARAITWGASFVAGPTALPTLTVTTKSLHVYFEWDSVQSKWVCISSGSDA